MTHTEIVVRNRHVLVTTRQDAATDSMSLVITVDAEVVWSSQEYDRQEIRYGADGDVFYAWSARRLIQIELGQPGSGASSVETAEDILTVFRLAHTCVIVTETRVEVHEAAGLAQIVELPDVVGAADLAEDRLTLTLFGGKVVHLRLTPHPSGTRLIAPSG